MLLGIIIGAFLTIGGAYVFDSTNGRIPNGLSSTAAGGQAPMVNWDVVGTNWDLFKANVRESTDNLQRSLKGHVG
jgi:hypothetical protein